MRPGDVRAGWPRVSQDALEADDHAEPFPFLDRPVGYVTMRWAVVFIATICGGVVGTIVADATIPAEPQTEILPNFGRTIVGIAGGFVGALIGGLAVGLWLVLARRSAKRETLRHASSARPDRS